MSSYFQKGIRYWHTVRYLRFVQIARRIHNIFRSVVIDQSPYQGTIMPSGHWIQPARQQPSMLGKKKFCFLNEHHEITKKRDWNHSNLTKLWLYNLHYFDDLNAFDNCLRVTWHRDLIQRWIEENPPTEGIGWEPYPTSLRIVNWIKWGLAGNSLGTSWQHSLVVQVRFLSSNMETHLLGNHLFVNAKALVFAGLFFKDPEAEEWYVSGLQVIERELSEQVLADGGNFELSTMYHSIFLEDLLDLVNLHHTFNYDLPKNIEAIISKMIFWLNTMCHPDGEISFFNDAALGITPSVDELLSYAEDLGFFRSMTFSRLVDLPESGYSRVNINDAVALIDRAAIGPDYLPGHAHADTLSFELSLFNQRVIVNSGTSLYGIGPDRHQQRGTAAHSTVVIDNENSSEVWSGFRVARRARVFHRENLDKGNQIVLSACHNGYTHLTGKPMHCRKWVFSDRSLMILDRIDGSGIHTINAVFPLHPNIEVASLTNDHAVLIVAEHQIQLKFAGTGTLYLKESTYHPEFGVSVKNHQLVYQYTGKISEEIKTRISW